MTIHGLGSRIAELIAGQTPQEIYGLTAEDSVPPDAGGAVGAAPDSYVAASTGGNAVSNDPDEYAKQFINITVNGAERTYEGSVLDDIAYTVGGNDDFIAAFTKEFEAWFATDAATQTLLANGFEVPSYFEQRFRHGKLDYEACVYVARALQEYVATNRPQLVELALNVLFDPSVPADVAAEATKKLTAQWPDAQLQTEAMNATLALKQTQGETDVGTMLGRQDVRDFLTNVATADQQAPTPVIDPFAEDSFGAGTYLPPDRVTYNNAYRAHFNEERADAFQGGLELGLEEGAAQAAAEKGPVSGKLATEQGYQRGYVYSFSGRLAARFASFAGDQHTLGGAIGFGAKHGTSKFDQTTDFPFEVPTKGSVGVTPSLSIDASLFSGLLSLSTGVVEDPTESESGLGGIISSAWTPGDGPVTLSAALSWIKPIAWGDDLALTDAAVSTQIGIEGKTSGGGFAGGVSYLTFTTLADGDTTTHIVPLTLTVSPLADLAITAGWTGIFMPADMMKQVFKGGISYTLFPDLLTVGIEGSYASKTSTLIYGDPTGDDVVTATHDTGMKTGAKATLKLSDAVTVGANAGWHDSRLGQEDLDRSSASGVYGNASLKVTF